ncbi:solute carrier family 22 member 7a [Danio rerio]|uniref:Solute carrier family 22 member 7 n=1 Tax=Danio rerio TaxID=7955 RepID=A4IG77_DANRE|nr:solute carrier family 22 member 7a [Danio rerio]AAI34965.1 Zgc:162334 protein [Danio rerio]|eukprot:NP_001077330.1 solute carrier family 22 member 7 [Danio rerio]
MRFEDVLREIGGFNKFQFLVLYILWLPRVILPLHFLLHNFISGVPPHHCALPRLDGRFSASGAEKEELAQIVALGIPRNSDGSYSSCKMYTMPMDFDLNGDLSVLYGNRSNVSVPCQNGWVYDRSQFTSTTATEWDLVCDNKKLNQALATFFFIGVTMGAVVFGQLSDKFGRKPMIQVSFVSSAVFGIIEAFSSSYVMFAIARTLCGFALTGMSITTVALCVEWTDVKHRTFTGTIISLGWSVGNMLLALLAYLIRDWRHLILVVTSPCLVGIIAWWWIPESARWLLANGRVEEAQKYLINCAKMNGKYSYTKKLDIENLKKITIAEDSNKNHSYLDLVRTPKLRKIVLCSGIFWFAVAFTYYGISFNITGFGLNIYLTQFIYGVIEVPAKVGTYLTLDRIGRRNGQAWSLIIAGALIGLNSVIPTEFAAVRTGIAVIGKGFSEAAFTIAFLYTSELYPTVLRQCGLGYTSFIARIGGSLAPMVILFEDIWHYGPPVVFSATAVFSGCVVFLLPETTNVQLPENILDVEEGRHTLSTEAERDVELNEMNSGPADLQEKGS